MPQLGLGLGIHEVGGATTEISPLGSGLTAFVGTNAGEIEIVDVATGSKLSSFSPTGGAISSGGKKIAYAESINRLLYASGVTLRSVKRDGTSDTLAYTFAGNVTHIHYVHATGSVWVHATGGRDVQFLSSNINLDTTWDAPDKDSTSATRLAMHGGHDGTNETLLRGYTAASGFGLGFTSPPGTFLYTHEYDPVEDHTAVIWDGAIGIVWFQTDTDYWRALDASPWTKVVLRTATHIGRVDPVLVGGVLYHCASLAYKLEQMSSTDGSGLADVYEQASASSINALDVYELP